MGVRKNSRKVGKRSVDFLPFTSTEYSSLFNNTSDNPHCNIPFFINMPCIKGHLIFLQRCGCRSNCDNGVDANSIGQKQFLCTINLPPFRHIFIADNFFRFSLLGVALHDFYLHGWRAFLESQDGSIGTEYVPLHAMNRY